MTAQALEPRKCPAVIERPYSKGNEDRILVVIAITA
jgi:hypothetical protein